MGRAPFARKRFGQNFLVDEGVIDTIVAAIAPGAGDSLVEIGPGRGALTLPLLQRAGRLDVVEIDRDLIEPLRTQALIAGGELVIHNCDALRFQLDSLAVHAPLRVVGNLPYNISTPLIFRLLEQADLIADMHFMLQREVVERLTATPGGGEWGRLAIMVQQRCRCEALFEVPPEAFRPAPKVHSAVVRLTPHQEPVVDVGDQALFARLVRQLFAQRRKTIRNNLRGWCDDETLAAAAIDPGDRPERLTMEQMATLSRRLTDSGLMPPDG
jgi:16S rRNA (adenine1518-N6/adenine1519-N6)-dimethyltransferase